MIPSFNTRLKCSAERAHLKALSKFKQFIEPVLDSQDAFIHTMSRVSENRWRVLYTAEQSTRECYLEVTSTVINISGMSRYNKVTIAQGDSIRRQYSRLRRSLDIIVNTDDNIATPFAPFIHRKHI